MKQTIKKSWLSNKHSLSNGTLSRESNKKTRHEEYIECYYYASQDVDDFLDSLDSMIQYA